MQFRKYKKYEISNYYGFILTVSLIIQICAVFVCIVSIMKYKNVEKSFKKAMVEYLNKQSLNSKKYIDNVQFNFQCCGWTHYEEWFGYKTLVA